MSQSIIGQGGNPVPSLQLVATDNETIFGDGSGQRPLTTNGSAGSPALTRIATFANPGPAHPVGSVVRATSTPGQVGLAFANSTLNAQSVGLISAGGVGEVTYVYEGPLTLTDSQWSAVNDQGTALNPGSPYYLSAANAGNITFATGESDEPLVQVGVALDANTMLVNTMLVLPALLPAATPTNAPVAGMALRVSSSGHLAPLLADGSVAPACSALMIAGNIDGTIQYKTNGPLTLLASQWDSVVTGESGGLTAGAAYYVSAAAAGKLTVTPPAATGSYIVPVGVALSPTTLIVNIGAPVGPHS